MSELAPGQAEIERLNQAGFSSEETAQWQAERVNELHDAGFSSTEIGEYFGEKNPDMSATKAYVQKNLSTLNAPKADATPGVSTLPGAVPVETTPKKEGEAAPAKEASTFLEAVESGFQLSVAGLVKRGKMPDTILPEHAGMAFRIAHQAGMLIPDLPIMAVGGSIGGATGGVAGAGIGTAVAGPPGTAGGLATGSLLGAGAGSFALPTAMRETLMQHYQKGDIQDFGDFWERSSAIFLRTMQDAAIGAATVGAGKLVGMGAKTLTPVVRNTAVAGTEIATMVTVGKAIEGEVPKAQDFADAGLVLLGLKGSMALAGKVKSAHIPGKLMGIYAKTGVKPEQVLEHTTKSPTVLQDVISSNKEVPTAYEGLITGETKPSGRVQLEAVPEQNIPGINGKASGISVEPFKLDPDATVVTEPRPAPKTLVEKTELQKAEDAVLSQIGREGKKPSEPYKFNDFYKDFVDAKDPLKVLEKMSSGEPIPVEQSPYIASRLFVDHVNKTKHFLEFGGLDYKTGQPLKDVPSLMKTISPFKTKEEVARFEGYLAAKRALEIEASGRTSGFDVEAAKTVVKGGAKEFDGAAKDIVKFGNSGLKYLKDSGLIDEAGFNRMVGAGEAYVPFHRLIESDGTLLGTAKGKLKPVRELKGSDAKISSPIEAVAKNMALYVKRAEQNRAIRTFVDFAEANKLGPEFIERVKTPTKKIEVKADELQKFFKDQGLEATAENMAIYRPESLRLGENDVVMFRDGKMEVYRMHKDLAAIYKQMDGSPAAGWVVKMLRPFASLQRATISITPDFIARNKIRDEVTAGVFSKHKNIPIYDSLVAIGDIIGKSEHWQGFLRSGGGNGSFTAIDSNYLQKNIFELNRQTRFIDKAVNVVKHPLEAMRVVSEVIENSTRVAAYKNAIKGKDPRTISLGESMAAGMEGREITVDFARMGAKAQAINQITAYWNVSVQGMDRTARAFQADPVGTTTKTMAYVTLPSVLLWWANKDDERMRSIPQWQKDAFWIVLTKDNIYRIPKPMEVGILFGSLPERVLEKYFTDNPDAMAQFDETVLKMFTQFVPYPTGLVPVVEGWANKSTFTGNPIVPHSLEGLLPQYQFNEYTSEVAKVAAQFVSSMPGGEYSKAASPMILENFVRSYAGNTGMYALKLVDEALTRSGVASVPPKPLNTLADEPFIKAFVVRYPSANTQEIVDFQETYEKQAKRLDTIRHLISTGNLAEMENQLAKADANGDFAKLTGIKEALTNSHLMIQFILRDPDGTPEEKRQLIDGIYYEMINAARMGRDMQRELDAEPDKNN